MARVVTDTFGFAGIIDVIGCRLVFTEAEKKALLRASAIIKKARATLREEFGDLVDGMEVDLDLAAIQHNITDSVEDPLV